VSIEANDWRMPRVRKSSFTATREAFATALPSVLSTDMEIAAWHHREAFAGPWPTTLRKIVLFFPMI
jgi:hypothetical protein